MHRNNFINLNFQFMKKVLLATIAFAAISMSSFAQEGFGWGVKAGINGADITKTDDSKMKIGFTAGVFVDYKFCNWFGASADVLYSAQGTKFKEGDDKMNMNMNYLNIPLLAKFYVVNGLHIDLGPQFGFLMSAKAKMDGEKESFKDNMKSFDFSVPVGVGYEFPMGLKLDLRYAFGVTNGMKEIEGYQSKAKNSVASLTVGWRF